MKVSILYAVMLASATAIPDIGHGGYGQVARRKQKCIPSRGNAHRKAAPKPNYQLDDNYPYYPQESQAPIDDEVNYSPVTPKKVAKKPLTKEITQEDPRLAHIKAQVPIGKSFMDGSKIEFIPHVGDPNKFLSYMSLELSYPQSEIAFNHLNSIYGPLLNRAEAHLTIVTPPEFNNTLRPFVSMEELNAIALSMNVQSSTIKPICVGKGTKLENNPAAKLFGKDSSVWYVVVESEDVIRIREAIWKVFVDRGGEPSAFDPRLIWPHITLGFQEKDWFPESNVFKTVYTCVAKLKYV